MPKTEDQQINAEVIKNPNQKVIDLETPIKRGETEIKTITLSRPKAGTLRGLSLQSVLQWDMDTMLTLLPRITQPPVTEHELASMEVADMTSICKELTGFLLTENQKSQSQLMK